MMKSTKWHDKFVADLPPKGAGLRKFEMVGVRRRAAAGQARLGAHKFQMFAVAQSECLANRCDRLRRSVFNLCDLLRSAMAVQTRGAANRLT